MNQDDIARLAALARLPLTVPERDRFAAQLDDILGYVKQIQGVDTSSVSDDEIMSTTAPAWRDDAPTGSLSRDAALANAPDAAHGLMRVPRVIG